MSGELDRVVRRAQAGDAAAVDEVLRLLRGPLGRQLRRLGVRAAEVDDVLQEALLDVFRGLGSYRWQSSFLGWAYAVAARRAWRHVRARRARETLEAFETWLAAGEDPLEAHELKLVAQDAHLRCALAVAHGLSQPQRRAYLLGEVLGVTDAVGADVLGTTPATFRQRVCRARRVVRAQMASGPEAEAEHVDRDAAAVAELARLDVLGQLHRAHGRSAGPEEAVRALRRAAPSLHGA